MKHRIFIAINLSEDIKKKLLYYQQEIEDLFVSIGKYAESPIRWTKKENLHITLVFIGYVQDEEIDDICRLVGMIAKDHEPFLINLYRICYGPLGKTPPRMVWICADKPKELEHLQKELERMLGKGRDKTRPHVPHITLGRINPSEFKKIDPRKRPVIEDKISSDIEVSSIEIMESHLKREGAEYTVIESIKLGGQ